GLDQQARHLVWGRLHDLKRNGVAMLLTTHYMEEAEQLCDRLIVMDHGRIVSEGTPDALIEQHVGHDVLEVATGGDPVRRARVETLVRPFGAKIESMSRGLVIYADGRADMRALQGALAGEDVV